jgi:RNase P subunit RPR2
MDQKIYHGVLSPIDIARTLAGQFNRGNLRVQIFGDENRSIIQIATGARPSAGGQTDLSVIVQKVADGVAVQVGQQNYLGVAASLGASAFAIFRNPLNLLGRINHITADVQALQLTAEVWRNIDEIAQAVQSTTELSERLRRVVCNFCNTANPPGEPHCIACGAPLGDVQLKTCQRCGFVVRKNEKTCPNCASSLQGLVKLNA